MFLEELNVRQTFEVAICRPNLGSMGEHSFAWDVANVPAGTYFCVIQTPTSGRQERGGSW